MENKDNEITARQLMNFIICTQIGIAALTLPNGLALKCGHDGWIAVAFFGTIITGAIIVIILLLQRYNDQSIYGINKLLYGKYIGGALNILIVIYLWYSTCLFLRTHINILKIIVLRLTPPVILTFFIIIPTYYLVLYGLKFVARFTGLIWIIIGFCLILFVLVSKNLTITFLMPVGECGIKGIIDSFDECMYAFIGYELIAIIYPEITNKDKTMKYMMIANITSIMFYVIMVLVCTSFFGCEMLKYSLFPIIRLSRSYRAPIIERIDLLFVTIWFPAMAMATRGYFSACYYSINKLFNLKKTPITLIGFTVITIFLSRIPRSASRIYFYNRIMAIGGAVFTGFLIISYIFSFINNRGVKKSE
jgi:spore germination protein (amino acid permease)